MRYRFVLPVLALLFFPPVLGSSDLVEHTIPGSTAQGADPEEIPGINGMVYIPPGEFIMGSTQREIENGSADWDEFPQRKVFVDGFYMDLHEVTNAQYKIFVDSMKVEPPSYWMDGRYPVGMDGYPVVGVSWYNAKRYAEFVRKRLPTEAEWEKAARGSDGWKYPWGDSFDNKKCNNGERLMPVRSFPQGNSPFGLFDMAGNAAEWVEDWYAPYPRGEEDVIDPETPKFKPSFGQEKYKVYRGGSWNSFGKFLRCANRERAKPDAKWGYVGFRCAMDPPWKKGG